MESVRRLGYLLDKKTKIKSIGMFVMIIIGSVVELIGVSIVVPIVNLAMDTGELTDNTIGRIAVAITGLTEKKSVLIFLILATIIIYIFKSLYLIWLNGKMYSFSSEVRRKQANKLLNAYMYGPYSFFLNTNSSDLIRNISSDTVHLFQVIYNIFQVLSNALTSIVLVIFLAISNLIMTLTVAGLMFICVIVVVFVLQKRFRAYSKRNQELLSLLTKNLQQSFGGIKEIKILNEEEHFINEYDKLFKENVDIEVKYSLRTLIPKYLIEVVCISGILIYLGLNILYNPNYISIVPQLAVFCVAAYRLMPCVNAIYANANSIIYYSAGIDEIYDDIKMAENLGIDLDVKDNGQALPFNESILVNNISYKYDNSENYVFKSASLEIKKGHSVALVGASGGGKTTMADIILSLLNPQEGTIKVDGIDINENIGKWRNKFGYIPQFIYLNDDTIRRNIAFGIKDDEINDKKIWEALEQAQLKSFVEELPDGLDTEVGERGARISGGQRQRLGIARALYNNPEILVFDEATSALDNETEKEVMSAIEGLQGTKTILMIAHRLTTIENCDEIYRVENGTVVKVDKNEVLGREE